MKLRDSVPGKLKSEGLLPALQDKSKDSYYPSPISEELHSNASTEKEYLSFDDPSASQVAKSASTSEVKSTKSKKDETVVTVEPPPRPLFIKGKARDGRWL